MAVENRLKEQREKKGMTQEELAEKITQSPELIEAWESGEKRLPLEYAFKLVTVLGCKLEDLSAKNPPKATKPMIRG